MRWMVRRFIDHSWTSGGWGASGADRLLREVKNIVCMLLQAASPFILFILFFKAHLFFIRLLKDIKKDF